MMTIQTQVDVDSNGRVHLDLQTPFSPGKAEVLLVVEGKKEPEKTQSKYDFSEFAGKLKITVDPLEFQKQIRNEWN